MKKISLFIITILISISSYSQDTIKPLNIFNIAACKNSIGLDLGIIEENRTYSKINFSFALNEKCPAYLNLGYGYLFDSNVFLCGLVGIYSKDNQTQLRFNVGGEVGYIINKKISTSVFCTNNTFGIKLGIAFENHLDKK